MIVMRLLLIHRNLRINLRSKNFAPMMVQEKNMQGVCIHQDKMWALDSYYGAEYILPINNNATVDLILPRKAFDELEKVIGKG